MNAGIFLHSTEQDNSIFDDALLFITEYNEKGAMGFIVNKRFSRNINELAEFSTSIPFPIYEGGPVDQEHLFFLHQRPDLISDGEYVKGNIYLGGDFKTAMVLINTGIITEKDIRIFIGYCGWDDDQLEDEIQAGSWVVTTGEIFG
ncbi:putative transcriptional regulator [Chitinophaga dinghuensis]|uniref:Putative transcriptional regulator n=1 Tax=Chitinophaga dinghuensis TaxID=1539050 RepID=A0A327VZK3_9BACT|nr:YqgE/AlgH family protein [Chitinophaga dinghuensis]RAJ81912.1 putative transcriptional regulator [Chitinophaga dinghuensis]